MRSTAVAVALAVLAVTRSSHAEDCALHTQYLGVPVWATDPNEGTTWGVMPIAMRTCPADGSTRWILAPSVTHNPVIHYTGSVRWFAHLGEDSNLSVIISASTRINYRMWLEWKDLPTAEGAMTEELVVRVARSAFARFYGIGADTTQDGVSSYTHRTAVFSDRHGLNVGHSINVGLALGVEHDGVEDRGVPGLPLSPQLYPDAPGMQEPATMLWQGLEVRFDDRKGGDYAETGIRAQATVALVEGLTTAPTFVRGSITASQLIPELDWLGGAWRAYWSGVSSSRVPFYAQSSLGGPFLLRGFPEGRFVDRQAWTLEFEQRVRVWRSHLFGVTADARVDPFIAVGQVFHDVGDAVSNVQLTGGLGFRVFVHPSIVGRVDVATGGEGVSVYVDVGYPY